MVRTVRELTIASGIPIGGHPGMVRPLVALMAEGAARAQHGELMPRPPADIRATPLPAENVGTSSAEDVSIGVGAILLMKGFFDSVG